MQNKSAIWVFTILLVLACLYQLSFSWVTKSFEGDVHQEAQKMCDSIELERESDFTDKEKQIVVRDLEQNLLEEKSDEPTYPLLDITYKSCKEQELGLGLDLQGGMSVILEVDIPYLVRSMASNTNNDAFTSAYNAAMEDKKARQTKFTDVDVDDFIGLFNAHYKDQNPDNKTMLFFQNGLKDYMEISNSDNEKIIAQLKKLSQDKIEQTQRVIETRINKFGVSQPNISELAVSGRIQIELPGAKDVNMIKRLLTSTAKLEFWDGADLDWGSKFIKLEKALSSNESANEDSELSDTITNLADTLVVTENADEIALDLLDDAIEDSLFEESDSLFEENEEVAAETEMKILNGTFTLLNQGSRVGVALAEDTSYVSKVLRSEIAKGIFSEDNYRLLWGRNDDDMKDEDGNITIPGHVLYAIEIPIEGEAKIDGGDIIGASQSYDPNGNPSVALTFNSNIADVWADWTEKKIGKTIAIVLDDQVFSAPTIMSKIPSGNTQISGGFETIEEAQDLAKILLAGSLPVPAKIVDEAIVGPSLGKENINSGFWSFVFAFILVLFYMIFYYKRAGWVANVALLANVFFIIGTLASLGAALTLPGIAGLVLTIGMSVDANVLIYERVREELRNGKGIKLAIQDGYKHAYSAIIDANVTSLLTAVVLAYFGSGPIKGFATTLIIGVFTSLFCAIFLTRLIFHYLLDSKRELSFSRGFTKNLFTDTSIAFLKKRKVFYILSALVVGFGIYSLATRGLDESVEFTGGRAYRVEFGQKINREEVKDAIALNCLDAQGNKVQPGVKTVNNDYTLEITTKYNEEANVVDASIEKAFNDLGFNVVNNQDAEVGSSEYKIQSSRGVEGQISDELKRNSFLAIIFSLFIIFIYIAYRFRKWQFGLGALIAMFHDVLVVLGLFSIFYNYVPFSMEIDQAFIAAILTVVGYSINDTVVVFDRIREYSILHKKSTATQVVDRALNSTLSRTINTSLSTFIVLLTIFIFGGESIKGFSFALMVGVIVGTYSSLFIATPLVVDISKDKISS